MSDQDFEDLYRALGYRFRDVQLLEEALMHRSHLNELHQSGRGLEKGDQQRLEFLGDAFLGYVVGRFLFDVHEEACEGALTKRRASLVKGEAAHAVGLSLRLDRHVRLGAGEEAHRTRNKKLLEDTVESVIGAVLLDGGDEAACEVVHRLFLSDYDASEALSEVDGDPLVDANEYWSQVRREALPALEWEEDGPDHARTWRATLVVDGERFTGEAARKQDARRAVFARALRWLREEEG